MVINLLPFNGAASVTQINCGTSSPRLSGGVNISAFPNLITFTCRNNDIVSFTGYSGNSNLQSIDVSNNKLTGLFLA